MCHLDGTQQVDVERVLGDFIKDGASFTGREIAKVVSGRRFPERAIDISSYVREIFNRGDMPGWASTQVIPGSGPVVYFKISKYMKVSKKIAQIKQELSEI